jgi:hypothetical protein
LRDIEKHRIDDLHVYYFDDIGVPSIAEMEAGFGSASEWQRSATRRWVDQILSECTAQLAAYLRNEAVLFGAQLLDTSDQSVRTDE